MLTTPPLQKLRLSHLSAKVMALILGISSVALTAKAGMAQNYNLIRAIPNPDPVNSLSLGARNNYIDNGRILAGTEGTNSILSDNANLYLFEASTGNLITTYLNPNTVGGGLSSVTKAIEGNYTVTNSPRSSTSTDFPLLLFDSNSGSLIRQIPSPIASTNTRSSSPNYNGISINNDRILATIRDQTTNPPSPFQVYLFDLNGNTLQTFNSPLNNIPSSLNSFGFNSVNLKDNYALIGEITSFNSFSAYLFDTNSGNLLQTFSFSGFPGGVNLIGEETNGILPIFISDERNDTVSTNGGAVFLYDGFTGNLLNTFLPPNPEADQAFGEAIDIDGDKLLIGALTKDVNGNQDVGEAYLYNWVTGDLLQTFSNPNGTANDRFGNSLGIEGDTIFIAARDDSFNSPTSGVLYVYEVDMGQNQNNPILPSNFDPNTLTYTFNDVISSQWFDPPFVNSFTYAITNPQSLFTKILDFPTGFDNSFNVSVEGNNLGIFAPGDMVDFVSLLGAGVKEFTVSGIDPLVDVENPLGFPIQLEFDTLRASFTMTANVDQAESTPESTFLLGFLGLGAWLITTRKRK